MTVTTPAWPRRLSISRVVVKATLLFVSVNVLFAVARPVPALAQLSLYNTVVPGRLRLPYSIHDAESYSTTLFQLDAMFASHAIARPKAPDEYRVLVLGDSSMWGVLLAATDTVAVRLNRMPALERDGRRMIFYNLAYPGSSAVKDLLLLKQGLRYQPDMVIWVVSLFAMLPERYFSPPVVQQNAGQVRELIAQYHLPLDPNDERLVDLSFWDLTLLGQRRTLADLLRLQLYGLMWAATGTDQFLYTGYSRPENDFGQDSSLNGRVPPLGLDYDRTLAILTTGAQVSGDLPLLVVNEPIFIADGENSQMRYNLHYPRWAYDGYRSAMTALAAHSSWQYLDLWDVVDASHYTNTAQHFDDAGSHIMTEWLWDALNGQGHAAQ